MSKNTVRIRMYRQGLGDCFLLSFPRQSGDTTDGSADDYHVLIDCGVITGSDPDKLIHAVSDILATTGGKLDLVVGTHEHWDHVSGFCQARHLFDQFKIRNIWLGWTEDPNNGTALGLQNNRAKRLAALRDALAALDQRASLSADEETRKTADSIRQVLGFFGEIPPAGEGLGVTDGDSGTSSLTATGRSTTRDAMQYLASRSDARVHYCYPSKDQPHPLEDVDDVRVYVFGPPEDLSLLKMSDPTAKGQETYGVAALTAEDSFFASITGLGANGGGGTGGGTDGAQTASSPYHLIQNLCYPFEGFFRIKPDDAKSDPFFDKYYFGANAKEDQSWRKIDNDWMSVTSELALNLDSDTNNTSLVLAFELGEPGSGKVLVFAADAQVGNWLSWGKLSWNIQGKAVTANQLLNNAVLYKVGHHGSHNATLREVDPTHPAGLELMSSDDLVAMIPVDSAAAVKRRWSMPFPELFTRLQQKTKGRIMCIAIPDSKTGQSKSIPTRQDCASLTDAQWVAFNQALRETDLYIEYCVEY